MKLRRAADTSLNRDIQPKKREGIISTSSKDGFLQQRHVQPVLQLPAVFLNKKMEAVKRFPWKLGVESTITRRFRWGKLRRGFLLQGRERSTAKHDGARGMNIASEFVLSSKQAPCRGS